MPHDRLGLARDYGVQVLIRASCTVWYTSLRLRMTLKIKRYRGFVYFTYYEGETATTAGAEWRVGQVSLAIVWR